MGPEFREHPCYGLVGIDPRGRASADLGRELTQTLIQYLGDWVRAVCPA
jgi:hypothetical protein